MSNLSCIQAFQAWRASTADRIEAISAEIPEIDPENHWDLIEDVKGCLSTQAANSAGPDDAAQIEAMEEAEEWVTKNLSHQASPQVDVAMALWLLGEHYEQALGRVKGPADTQAKQNEAPVEAMVQTVMAHTAEITESQALQLVTGKTEKAGGVDPTRQISASKGNGRTLRLRVGNIPLELFRPNESGDRYDGTVDIALTRDYASRPANNAPAVIAVVSPKTGSLNIIDGGHRISAARLRGDATLKTLAYLPTLDVAKATKTDKPVAETGPREQSAAVLAALSRGRPYPLFG